MDGLQRYVYNGQLLLKGLIDLRLAVDMIPQDMLLGLKEFEFLLPP